MTRPTFKDIAAQTAALFLDTEPQTATCPIWLAQSLKGQKDFARRYAWADLIVCRAGATTVAEIRAAGRAALFIPLAFAADDHQRKNARAMVDAGAARMLEPEELSGELLAEQIAGLVSQPERLAELGERARALAVPDAEARIVDLIERIVGGERES
jgi:UDP-N-acetylglucosamine--N-acetylmuramyl-(pentapeptide) pyrophosphoryl-undecaprenol N-acetylglucosamine transferase